MSTPKDAGMESMHPASADSPGATATEQPHPKGLLQHRDFLHLWTAQTLSMLGTEATALAIPLLAVVTLQASAFDMGVLALAASLPAPLFGLVAGVWTDRVRRRPILVGADLGRAVLLGTVPLAVFLDLLTIPYLCAVLVIVAFFTIWFDVAHASLLPALVTREQLVEGNSKLEISRSGAMIAGPGLAGLLIQAISAPVAILMDAFSYLVSAVLLVRIRTVEVPPERATFKSPVWKEAREGFRAVRQDRRLATMALSLSVFNLFSSMLNALFILFAVRELDIEAAALGLIFAVGSAGFPVGAAAAGWIARKIGVGWAIIYGAVISDLALLLIPLAGIMPDAAVPLLIASRVIAMLTGPVTAINQLSLCQSLTPHRLLGRVNATMLVLALGLAPLGALMAGGLGEIIGLQATVTVAAIGVQAGFVVLLVSPLRTLARVPATP
jgi:MFS family permease